MLKENERGSKWPYGGNLWRHSCKVCTTILLLTQTQLSEIATTNFLSHFEIRSHHHSARGIGGGLRAVVSVFVPATSRPAATRWKFLCICHCSFCKLSSHQRAMNTKNPSRPVYHNVLEDSITLSHGREGLKASAFSRRQTV